jgi:signal transduction histidine kinase/ActR/RegA family two-component response regulator
MFFSIVLYIRTLNNIAKVTNKKAITSSPIFFGALILMLFFLVAYLVVLILYIINIPKTFTETLISLIFFFGAIFVLVMVFMSRQIIFLLQKGKKLEIEKEEALQASIAKGEFLSRMSHEMRTPMNAIIGMANIGKKSPLLNRKNYCFDQIDSASSHLLNVINDILDISKIEAGKFSINQEVFDLRNMVKKLEDVIIFKTRDKKQNLKIIIEDDVPKYINQDEPRLYQVLMNLIGNANKFTPVAGTITLHISLEGIKNDLYYLHFSVSDTGIGISSESIDKLFNSYQQADQSIARKFGGTGLGLAISKQIIELMNGTIGVKSKEGQGTQFYFEIAVQKGELDNVQTETFEFTHFYGIFKGVNILLVEDIDINREILRELLSPTEIIITEAVNGKEAVDLFLANPLKFSAILMDIQMPVMDGYNATKAIRDITTDEAKNIPIIAMTASVFKEDIEKCLACGMNDHLAKPIVIQDVLKKLTKFIEKEKENVII